MCSADVACSRGRVELLVYVQWRQGRCCGTSGTVVQQCVCRPLCLSQVHIAVGRYDNLFKSIMQIVVSMMITDHLYVLYVSGPVCHGSLSCSPHNH